MRFHRSIALLTLALLATTPAVLTSAPTTSPRPSKRAEKGVPAPKTIDESIALAKKENKLLLLIISSPTCPHCIVLHKSIAEGKFIIPAKEFVKVELDSEDKEMRMDFYRRYKFHDGLPLVVVISQDGELLAKNGGAMDKSAFTKLLADARAARKAAAATTKP